jgi:hypothetical protein
VLKVSVRHVGNGLSGARQTRRNRIDDNAKRPYFTRKPMDQPDQRPLAGDIVSQARRGAGMAWKTFLLIGRISK